MGRDGTTEPVKGTTEQGPRAKSPSKGRNSKTAHREGGANRWTKRKKTDALERRGLHSLRGRGR